MSILTNPLSINVPVQGDLLRGQNKRSEHLPEDIGVSEAGEHAGFTTKTSHGRYFMATHDTDLNEFGHAGSCREYTSLRSDGWVRGNRMELKSELIP